MGSETVLLVEDEPLVRQVAARVLRQQGYSVLEASYGHEALGMAKERQGEQIHLLLTNIVMPLMGGKELAQRLRDTHPETSVLYPESTEGGRLVSILKWPEGALLNLG